MAIAILQNAGAGKPGQYKEFDITDNGMRILEPDPGYSLDYALLDVNVQPGEQKEIPEINKTGENTVDIVFETMTVGVKINANVPSADGNRTLIDGSITSYEIPEGTAKIRNCCFYGCNNMTYVKIPESITGIGDGAFSGCEKLKNVTLPCSINTIGDLAFKGCTNIDTYDFTAFKKIPSISGNALGDPGTQILVPRELYGEWVKSSGWAEYKNYIVAWGKSAPYRDKFKIYVDAKGLHEILKVASLKNWGIGEHKVLYEGNVPFLRIYGDGTSEEAFAIVLNDENTITGKYLVFAYRIPTSKEEKDKISWMQIYANTTKAELTGEGDLIGLRVKQDGKWHVAVIDLAEAINSEQGVRNGLCESQFIANSDGTYTIQKLRIDWFNRVTATDSYVDVAYVGICDSIDNARSADADYEGLEAMPDDFENQLVAKAVKSTYNGMEYVTITDTLDSTGEKYIEFYQGELVALGTSRYGGVLYRNASGRQGEVYISSSTSLEDAWTSYCPVFYDTKDGWHYAIFTLPAEGGYKDSVCRRWRYDYFNQLTSGSEQEIDIAFIKFFTDEKQAREYCEGYMKKYGLNQEET